MSSYDDGYQGALAKSSGKKAAFIIFVESEGKKKFFNEYGYHASIKNKEHTQILGAYYQELSHEQKQIYKNMEKRPEINSQKNYLERRHRDNSYRRTMMHNAPQAAFEAKRNHRQEVEREQDELIRNIGHINMPKPSRMFDANPLYKEDFCARRMEFRERWRDMLQFLKSKDGADGVLNKTFCYIGVTPACAFVTEGKNRVFLCTPLEISIVNFTLRDAITSRHTAHMMVDPCDVFQGKVNMEELINQSRNGVKFARRTGVPQHFQDKSSMSEVWEMVKENCGSDAPIVCDTDNLNFVVSSLYNMAYATDVSECALYQQRYDKNLCTVEDLALAMKYAFSSPADGDEELVKRFFKKEMKSVETFCPIHIRMRLDDMRRHYCQEARAAMNIQRLIDFLRSECIWGMETVFNTGKHILCTEHVGGERLPTMPKQPLISSRDDTGHKRLDNFMFSEPESEDEDAAIDAVTRQRLQENIRGQNSYRPEPNVITSVRVPTSPGPSRIPHEPVMTHDNDFDEPPPPVLGATARSLAQEQPSTSAPPPPPPLSGLQPTKSYSIPPEFIFDWEIVSEEQFRKMTPWKETPGGFRY